MAITKSTVQSNLTQRTAEIESEIERLQAKLAFIQTVPVDDFEHGSIVTFSKKFNEDGLTYTYVCLKINTFWYVTGRAATYSWAQLTDFIYGDLGSGGSVQVYMVTELTEIVQAGQVKREQIAKKDLDKPKPPPDLDLRSPSGKKLPF